MYIWYIRGCYARIFYAASEKKTPIIAVGHTHKAVEDTAGGILILNPAAASAQAGIGSDWYNGNRRGEIKPGYARLF
jgi:predicted phosphodiesterase